MGINLKDKVLFIIICILVIAVIALYCYAEYSYENYYEIGDEEQQTAVDYVKYLSRQEVITLDASCEINKDLMLFKNGITEASGTFCYNGNIVGDLIRYNDDSIRVPFHLHAQQLQPFDGIIYLRNNKENKTFSNAHRIFGDFNLRIDYDDMTINLFVYNSGWLSTTLETVTQNAPIEKLSRLENIKLNQFIFETYYMNNNYYFVTSTNPNQFILLHVTTTKQIDNLLDIFMINGIDINEVDE